MNEEPKPVRCGCGGEAQSIELNGYEAFVECKICGIETKLYDTEAEAIEAWNRAMSDQFRDLTKKIERMAKVSENATRLYCGECGERLDDYDDICGEPPIKYCPMCGCRLEWE